ncbi:MAG: hypothetical protein JW772_04700 [Candidatus Diapherotrites archaeon]|nr:hypothetical protein [Candidatus Diapherotrites archaeon]
MARKKHGLSERKLAQRSKSGKLGISAAGRERLEHLRDVRALRLSRIVQPAHPTKVTKKVLFVCPGGMESSLLAMKTFRGLANQNPVEAKLVLDYAGWMQVPKQEFEKDVLSADIVVPMHPAVRVRVNEVLAKTRKKILVSAVDFESISDQYDMGKYERVLKEVRGSLKK